MKIIHLTRLITIFLASTSLLSCAQGTKTNHKSQIRFVDLQGNPRKIRLNTPSENLTALTEQGKVSRVKMIEEQNYSQVAKKKKPLSYNKYGKDGGAGLDQPQKPIKSNELIYTTSLPTEKNDQKNSKKTDLDRKQNKEGEYELTKKPQKTTKRSKHSGERIISEIKFPSKENSRKKYKSKGKLRSGTYVQAGSFTTMNHAKQHLQKIKKLTNNPKNINIQSAKVRSRNYYRVVIGPVTKKTTAKLIIKDLKRKGQNSIIIKVR